MPTPLWEKGVSGNPAGRPKGSKDKKWAKLEYWYELVLTEWPALKPSERALIAMSAFKALLGRSQVSLTPEESVTNANRALETLKLLEEASQKRADITGNSRGDMVGVENRATQVQVSPGTMEIQHRMGNI